jgi:hypothetical protein
MTITLTREEAQQVLDALNSCEEDWIPDGEWETRVDQYDHKLVAKALEILRARLAQPEPEPVAGYRWEEGRTPPSVTFAAPPQRVYCSCGDGIVPDDGALCGTCVSLKKMREWKGLTHEEKMEILTRSITAPSRIDVAEAMLKEKNNG